MTILTILSYPDSRLRIKADPVTTFCASLAILAEDMADTMYQYKGIGLAATQVDSRQRLIVVDVSDKQNDLRIFVNPNVVESSGKVVTREGCLSVPDVLGYVERPSQILLEYYTLRGKRCTMEAEGLLAVCVQHEIDHLDGKVFIDHLEESERLKAEALFKGQ
ncbi:peptide deformylase [Candidatus Ichthyocystis hellenicum]|uniref:peptide deformylase n=1 Tax=Candidatus Ichthyocystis hellenicum TaxID=1561003 RepID=UPI000AB9A2EF|nr:peptide deformylase [Candidatus Ichthyocystis hellenicum]